ncbi:MAG: hypothetical protein HC850_09090, partial [Rhodomicrobium sp.]|nr:hypothetical protein [Rhodomicrobium sp.]
MDAAIGKREAVSSILTGSTSRFPALSNIEALDGVPLPLLALQQRNSGLANRENDQQRQPGTGRRQQLTAAE